MRCCPPGPRFDRHCRDPHRPRIGPRSSVLAALYWIGDSAPVRTKLRSPTISTGSPSRSPPCLLVGPWGACLVCVIGAVASGGHVAWFKRAFNVAQMALSALAAGLLLQAIPDGVPAGFSKVAFPAGAAGGGARRCGVLRPELRSWWPSRSAVDEVAALPGLVGRHVGDGCSRASATA